MLVTTADTDCFRNWGSSFPAAISRSVRACATEMLVRPRTCIRQAAKAFHCITLFTLTKAGSKMQNVKIHSKAHKRTSSAKARWWSSCLWMAIAMTCVRRVQWGIRWGRWPVHRQGCTRAWPCSPLTRWRWCCRWKGSIWCPTPAWCCRSTINDK